MAPFFLNRCWSVGINLTHFGPYPTNKIYHFALEQSLAPYMLSLQNPDRLKLYRVIEIIYTGPVS